MKSTVNASTVNNNDDGNSIIFSRGKLFLLLVCCCVYRALNAWCIETQFDPDEYWQTLEVAYSIVFGSSDEASSSLTWEWKNNQRPIRSYVSILPTITFYKMLKWFGKDSTLFIKKGPGIIHAVLIAGPTDFLIYMLGLYYYRSEAKAKWALLCSVTSWFQGYCLVRTYTNSIECFMITLVTMLSNNNNNSHVKTAFFLAGVTVAGVRFTSVAAFVPILLFIFLKKRQIKEKKSCIFFALCCCYGILGIFCCILVDRYFYGYWTIVCVNNFYVNIMLNYGSLYGTHFFFWYFLVGLPAICGTIITILLPLLLMLGKNGTTTTKTTTRSSENNMLLSVIVISYVTTHSISAHKEFRFILPVMPFMCLLTGHFIHKNVDDNKKKPWKKQALIYVLFAFLAIVNFCIWYYLSKFHQRAPIQVNELIITQLQKEILQKATNSSKIVHIHYLTGCHSTPTYSHLHLQKHHYNHNISIQVRTLDCSPTCRLLEQNQLQQFMPICESNLFLNDPQLFVQTAYNIYHHDKNNNIETCPLNRNDTTCTTNNDIKILQRPDFLVIYRKEAITLSDMLVNQMGMELMHEIPNGIQNIRMANNSKSFEIEYDYMYLYQKKADTSEFVLK